jgi:hypothetical protein
LPGAMEGRCMRQAKQSARPAAGGLPDAGRWSDSRIGA